MYAFSLLPSKTGMAGHTCMPSHSSRQRQGWQPRVYTWMGGGSLLSRHMQHTGFSSPSTPAMVLDVNSLCCRSAGHQLVRYHNRVHVLSRHAGKGRMMAAACFTYFSAFVFNTVHPCNCVWSPKDFSTIICSLKSP